MHFDRGFMTRTLLLSKDNAAVVVVIRMNMRIETSIPALENRGTAVFISYNRRLLSLAYGFVCYLWDSRAL